MTFLEQLKSKPLKQYQLAELQEWIDEAARLHKSMRKTVDKVALKQVYHVMALYYNETYSKIEGKNAKVYIENLI